MAIAVRTPPPNRKEGLLITHDTGVRYALIAIGNLVLQPDFCEPFVDMGTTGDYIAAVFEAPLYNRGDGVAPPIELALIWLSN